MASVIRSAPDRSDGLTGQESDALKDTAEVKGKSVPSDMPDGGFAAWVQCAGAFILFQNSWGIVNMFGMYNVFAMEMGGTV